MSLGVKQKDGIVILTPNGEFYGGKESEELERKLKELSETGNRKLLVNLGQTTFMSSVPLNELINCHVSYKARDAKMKLCELNAKVLSLLVITKLIKEFDVYDTEEEALKSFSEEGEVGAIPKEAATPSLR